MIVQKYGGTSVGTAARIRRVSRRIAASVKRGGHVVVVVSEVLRDELLARGVAPERIVCHANGVDPKFFDPDRLSGMKQSIRRSIGLSADAIVVTFVGTFGRWHGVDVLARAIVAP